MNGKVPVDYVLFKINEMFKVVDISNTIVTAEDIGRAKKLHSQLDFDRVPIVKNGQILSYYDYSTDSEKKIEANDVLSDSLGILETFSYLSKRDSYFVISGNELTHIVHYSDLNNPLALISIYTQIAYCEKAIRDFARSKNSDKTTDGINKFLKELNNRIIGSNLKIDICNALKAFNRKTLDMQTDLFDELYFCDELILFRELVSSGLKSTQLVKFKNSIKLDDTTIKRFNKLRNNIMHSKPKIINTYNDVGEWLGFLQTCQDIIKVIDKKMEFL